MAEHVPDATIRAGDAEREQAVATLREHAAHGRLDVEELDQRVQAAYSARTRGELGALLRDLPPLAAAPPARPARVDAESADAFKRQLVSTAVLILFLIGIWAASGGGYFWPVWPMLGLGAAAGLHGAKVLWPSREETRNPSDDS
jgi:hypothetical protein